MGRIRTIKPELPQSESMGRVSRESRLCFILLWTLADDAGRLRGNSRMLASLLYPYDDDAKLLIDGWLKELDDEGCIVRYEINGDHFIQIKKWLQHQKIDKPSLSKIPEFVEGSRGFANVREGSFTPAEKNAADQGRDKGPKEQGEVAKVSAPASPDPLPPVQPKRKPKSTGEVTFTAWCTQVKDRGEKLISGYEPVWDYAEKIGIPTDWINLAWAKFKDRYSTDPGYTNKKYQDWRRVFLNAITENWFDLWTAKSGQFSLSTRGQQAELAMREAA